MTKIVFNAPDLPTLVTAAEAMGYYEPGIGIIENGVIPGGGVWFYNYVGQVVATPALYNNMTFPPTLVTPEVMAPGVWGRLIHNGDPSYIPVLPSNSGVTLYEYNSTLSGWTSDGVNLAPSYVGTAGLVM